MVRKAAQLRMGVDAKSNGVGPEPNSTSQEMDLDSNGGENIARDQDTLATELGEVERKMLEYGQALQSEYANDHRREVIKALDEIWALVAYPNPLKEPQVSHMLDRKGRVAVAEELNSAILCE